MSSTILIRQWLCPHNHNAARHQVLKQSLSLKKVTTDTAAIVYESWDGYKLICSVWRPGAFTARSQGKPKIAVKIADGSNVCLSGCSSITKYARIMTLAPFERLKVTDSSNYSLWDDTPQVLELWASDYLEILLK